MATSVTNSMGFVVPVSKEEGTMESGLPFSKVELSVKCKDLKNKDLMSKSDPYCVVYQKKSDGSWFELGRTEVIMDNLNPEFMQKVLVKYSFEEKQDLKFEVFDYDEKKKKKPEDAVPDPKASLGFVNATLASLVTTRGLKGALEKGKGEIVISAYEISNDAISQGSITMKASAAKLDNKDTFGKSDPFFTINKSISQEEFMKVYESEWIKNDLNPTWKPATISLKDLCNGELNRLLRFDVFDYSSNGKHELIGSFETSVSNLMTKRSFDVVNPKKKDKKKYVNSGTFKIDTIDMDTPPSFLDYVQGGLSMNFAVAIDFTASNGNIKSEASLHKRNASGENKYTAAIKTVGDIIEDYDSDKKFPAYGFGARLPPLGNISHDFYLNLTSDTPYCQGISGILDAYFKAVDSVELYGPTNFAPVINRMAGIAGEHVNGSHYFVLLILTDGAITDIEDTKAALVKASHLPMSVIIVGIGDADFESMVALDSDKEPLVDPKDGTKAFRDIVQFVEMDKFVRAEPNGDIYWDRPNLAKAVLAEIPKQVITWMVKKGVKPIKG